MPGPEDQPGAPDGVLAFDENTLVPAVVAEDDDVAETAEIALSEARPDQHDETPVRMNNAQFRFLIDCRMPVHDKKKT